MNFYLIHTLKFEFKPANIPSEIFAILCQLATGPSVQAPEIIKHVDASFYLKKSRWAYQSDQRSSCFSLQFLLINYRQ